MDCSICFEPYKLDKKAPYLLGCGHTFCLSCIQALRSWRCPNCDMIFETNLIKPNFSLIDVINNNHINHTSPFKQILAATNHMSVEELVTLQEQTNNIIIQEMEKRENEHLCAEIRHLQKERNELCYDITELTTEIQQLDKYLNDRKSLKYSKSERIKEIDYRIKNIDQKKSDLLDLDPFTSIDQVFIASNMDIYNNTNNDNQQYSNNNNKINPFANLLIPTTHNTNNAFSNFDPFANI